MDLGCPRDAACARHRGAVKRGGCVPRRLAGWCVRCSQMEVVTVVSPHEFRWLIQRVCILLERACAWVWCVPHARDGVCRPRARRRRACEGLGLSRGTALNLAWVAMRGDRFSSVLTGSPRRPTHSQTHGMRIYVNLQAGAPDPWEVLTPDESGGHMRILIAGNKSAIGPKTEGQDDNEDGEDTAVTTAHGDRKRSCLLINGRIHNFVMSV